MDISQRRPSCNTLIDDVLRQIFICCVYDEGFIPNDLEKLSICHLPQISVSRVSSQWRRVALDTPQLWNKIKIRLLNPANFRMARQYLSRGGTMPISISLGFAILIANDQESSLTDFLSSFRLRSITLLGPIQHFSGILHDLPEHSVTDLESLIINRGCEYKSIDINDIRYPNLTIVKLPVEYNLSGYSSSLRIFHGKQHAITISESWDFLRNFPALEDVWLRIVSGDVQANFVPQIKHQHIHTLKIRSHGYGDQLHFKVFIEALSLPRLEELLVAAGVVWCTTAFQLLIQRSNYMPNFRKFSLIGPECDIIDAGALLASMPYVTVVNICCHPCRENGSDIFFEPLALAQLASGSLAPQLQRLGLGCVQDVSGIIDMIESRMEHARMSSQGVPAPFTEIMLYVDDDFCLERRELPIILGDFFWTLRDIL